MLTLQSLPGPCGFSTGWNKPQRSCEAVAVIGRLAVSMKLKHILKSSKQRKLWENVTFGWSFQQLGGLSDLLQRLSWPMLRFTIKINAANLWAELQEVIFFPWHPRYSSRSHWNSVFMTTSAVLRLEHEQLQTVEIWALEKLSYKSCLLF